MKQIPKVLLIIEGLIYLIGLSLITITAFKASKGGHDTMAIFMSFFVQIGVAYYLVFRSDSIKLFSIKLGLYFLVLLVGFWLYTQALVPSLIFLSVALVFSAILFGIKKLRQRFKGKPKDVK